MDDASATDSINRPQRRVFRTQPTSIKNPMDEIADPPQPDTPMGYSEKPKPANKPKRELPKNEPAEMHKLRLNDLMPLDGNNQAYDGVSIRVRRVSSGWLYEYYKVKEDAFTAVVFVPYSEEKPEKQKGDDKTSFMYRLGQNEKTAMFGRIAGMPEDSGSQVCVRRVPGGWIYEYYNDIDQIIDMAVFVAMNGHKPSGETKPRS